MAFQTRRSVRATVAMVASPLIRYKRGAITTGGYTAAFSASQMFEDFDLIEQAAATSCDLPLISSIRNVHRAAVARGPGDQDFFVLASEDARPAPGAR
jgi:3-hydroxyisobutyrate dehydrogenase-like beta-hydroxyacid dehydrogenase